jgi:hypothetical protein
MKNTSHKHTWDMIKISIHSSSIRIYALSTRRCYKAGFLSVCACECVRARVCVRMCGGERERESERERVRGRGGAGAGTCGLLYDFWDPKCENRRGGVGGVEANARCGPRWIPVTKLDVGP